MSDEKKTREIDLFELFASFGKGIKNLVLTIYDALMWCLFFAVKKYKILLIFFIIGLSYGIFQVSTGKKFFSSNMLIRSNAVTSFQLKEILDEFNNYFEQSNEFSDETLMNELLLDSTELSNILGIESFFGIDLNTNDVIDFYDLKENHSKSDTINVRSDKYLLIKANILDPLILPKFQEKFIDYLNQLPLLVHENEQRLNYLENLIENYDLETMYLDSLQKSTYFEENKPQISMGRNEILLGNSNKYLVHNYKFQIYALKKEVVPEYFVYNDPVTVINDFSMAAKQESSSAILIIKDIILFFILGYIILLVQYFLSKVSGKYMSRID